MKHAPTPWKKSNDALRAEGCLFCGNGLNLVPGDIVYMPGWRKLPHAGKFGRVVKLHPRYGELGRLTVQFAGEPKATAVLPAHVVSCPLRSRLSQRQKGAKQ